MKKLIALACLISTAALAQQVQQATPTQQTATRLDAATLVTTATAAAASQATATITPPSGQYVYVTAIEVDASATTAPTATLLTHTSTNLGGWTAAGVVGVANTCDRAQSQFGGVPLKSTVPGTAVTVVSNAGITSVTYRVTVTYYLAP